MYKKLILIDLDGVLNNYIGNYEKDFIPEIKNGAYSFLKELSQTYEIKIFTTRNRLLTAKWLIQNNIDCFVTDITNIKEPAFLYIDDRCVNFEGNFVNLQEKINTFKTYWKN